MKPHKRSVNMRWKTTLSLEATQGGLIVMDKMPVKSTRYVILRMYEEALAAIVQFESSMCSDEDV